MGHRDDTIPVLRPPAESAPAELVPASLAAYLATIPDPRSRRGRHYDWPYLLVLLAAALLAGEQTLVGISQWVNAHAAEVYARLQPPCRPTPSLSTLRRVVYRVSLKGLEAAVSAYVRSLQDECGDVGTVVTPAGERLCGQAVDGKTVCGATAHGARLHLVTVVRHGNGLVLAQQKVRATLGEAAVAQVLLGQLPLAGTVTTFDALHTSRKQAEQIRAGGGHYLFVVKRNRAALYRDIDEIFAALPPAPCDEADFWQYATLTLDEQAHGRTTHYTLERTTALNRYLAFPDVGQVVRRIRTTRSHRTRQTSVHQEYLITSLSPADADLAQIAQLRRGHWTIENVTHYPRDVSMGEDRSMVHAGNAPQALAALRNAVAALLRIEGWPYLPNGFRFCRHNLQQALHWLGFPAT